MRAEFLGKRVRGVPGVTFFIKELLQAMASMKPLIRNAHDVFLKTLLGVAVVAFPLLTVGCASETPGAEAQAQTEGASDTLNTLTKAQRESGWQLLFDGDSLSKWRGYKDRPVPEGWSAQNGQITLAPPESDTAGGDLVTKKQYDDFEFRFDWKISKGGNSGVIYRLSEDQKFTFMTGPEYQILDDAHHSNATDGPAYMTGANYALHATDTTAIRSARQWNEARILVRGDHVEHWLNGQKVVEYELGSADWKQRVADSKFSDWPGYGQNDTGRIALQDHSQKVWFRNLAIRSLGE
jgi:hypothetical protein